MTSGAMPFPAFFERSYCRICSARSRSLPRCTFLPFGASVAGIHPAGYSGQENLYFASERAQCADSSASSMLAPCAGMTKATGL